MQVPADLLYTESHEWVRIEDGVATIGITSHATEELGDIIYVELGFVGKQVKKGEMVGTVESVKAVSEVYTPLSGSILDANSELPGKPETVNEDPFGAGWMVKIQMTDEKEAETLMSASEYEALLS
jgi:glycine cleavage system H protein